ncbi:uncharacterized protein G2W53_038326 [Senna tora]|uniref:Uncharacterized protein n=1 Tax=Senna tora TaxID=362788 RepID=A0A834W1Y4_9FABA|nr:uncharacterized protein G2W53_038326 [Senna tora]
MGGYPESLYSGDPYGFKAPLQV